MAGFGTIRPSITLWVTASRLPFEFKGHEPVAAPKFNIMTVN